MWQARRDSNPQHPDLESDALPLELLACMIRFASGNCLFGFFVRRMLTTKPTIFVKLQFIRRRAFILGCRIISSFAISARKGNYDSHLKDSLAFIR